MFIKCVVELGAILISCWLHALAQLCVTFTILSCCVGLLW